MNNKIDWMNRLAKWRAHFAGWQLGTRLKGDPESDAVRDHRECTIIQRAELNALACLLIEKGVFTSQEWTDHVYEESRLLCDAYEKRWPGVKATDDGLQYDARALEFMVGWLP